MRRRELLQLAERRAPVRVTRSISGAERTFGFVLDASRELVLLAKERDFARDGYTVLRRKDIRAVRSGDKEELHASWLRAAGWPESLEPHYPLDITDMAAVFRSVRDADLLVIVEDERPRSERFDLGTIARIKRKSVWINYVDTRARSWWTPSKFRYRDITCIRFDDPYSHMFKRHLSWMPACPVCGQERHATHDRDVHADGS